MAGGVDRLHARDAEVPGQVRVRKGATKPPDAASTWIGTSGPPDAASASSAAAISLTGSYDPSKVDAEDGDDPDGVLVDELQGLRRVEAAGGPPPSGRSRGSTSQ